MSQPFSRIPEPEIPRPFKRRLQPDGVQRAIQGAWRQGRRHAEDLRRHAADLWRKGKRHPRVLGMIGGAAALTLVGAYTLSASGAGRSLCTSASKAANAPEFLLLMDPITRPILAGPELEIHYDVCGLASGTAYQGRLQITRQRVGKKSSVKPKPVVIKFEDRVDGVATRRHRDVELGKLKPGPYTLELSVVDNRGRLRKKVQKIVVNAR